MRKTQKLSIPEETTMENNKPEQSYAAGGVRLAVWKNKGKTKEGQESDYHTAKLERRYKDQTGNWQSTASLHVNDLPKARLLLEKAYENLVLKNDEEKVIPSD